jgi:DNA-directed RNA polymerase specialized sigma24 family protein
MQDHKKHIYSVIEEILSHLYMFALRMTSSQKMAEKLKLVSIIDQNDLEEIIINLPIRLRPYMLLKDICDFSYHQISYILDVPQDVVASNLGLVNKIFQLELWKNLVHKRQHVSS